VLLDSTPGQGTRIEILLPAHAPPAAAAVGDTVTAPAAPAVSLSTRTILVVDDEDAVRRLVAAVLRRHGFSIIEAANGREALAALAERYDVDLVISDVLMPELGGRELAKQLQRDRPEMPVLFISGYTNQELANEGGSLDTDATFLAKPFSSQQLMSAVSTLLH
jgi:CheY-like chemotaxis protein